MLKQLYGALRTKYLINLRKETWHNAEYNQCVLNMPYYEQFFQYKHEFRGSNTTRSTCHIGCPRNVSIYWDCHDDVPDGYDIYIYFEKKWQRKYNSPLCAQKIHKSVKSTSSNTGQRKIQVSAQEMGAVALELMVHRGWDLLQRRAVRYALVDGGPFDMPIVKMREATEGLDLTSVAHHDVAYLNVQRQFAIRFFIINNMIKGKIDPITGKIKPNKKYYLSPSCVDANTMRNGMRDINNKFSFVICVFYNLHCVCYNMYILL